MKKQKSTILEPWLGAHVSIAGGFDRAIDRALSVGCNVMQVFVKSNRQWFAPPLANELCRPFLEHPRRKELHCVFAHSSYLINLAAAPGEIRTKSIRALIEEIQRADQLKLPFLVLHPGAHLGVGMEKGIQQIVKAVDEVIDSTSHLKTCVALETTAGQGSSIGHELEQLASILDKVKKPDRFCICVDTAHLFAAGYEIHKEKGYQKTFSRLDQLIGLKKIVAFHLNDSKTPFGSRVDRHEHIGKGHIGLPTFQWLMNDKRFQKIPKVLETPKSEDMHEDRDNLQQLYRLLRK